MNCDSTHYPPIWNCRKMKIPPQELDDYPSPNFYSNGNGIARDTITPVENNDFSEYMWMEHEEEFDKEIMQQLEEEALMEECIEAMFLEEQEEEAAILDEITTSTLGNGASTIEADDLCQRWQSLSVAESEALARQSTLNPNAAEFVPQQRSRENLISVRLS